MPTTGTGQCAAWLEQLKSTVGGDLKTQASNFAQVFAGGKACLTSDFKNWVADASSVAPCIDDAINFADPGAQIAGLTTQQIQDAVDRVKNASVLADIKASTFGDLQSHIHDLLSQLPNVQTQVQQAAASAANISSLFQQICGGAYANPSGQLPPQPPSMNAPAFGDLLHGLLNGSFGFGGAGSTGGSPTGTGFGGLSGVLGSLFNRTTAGGSAGANVNVTGLLGNLGQFGNLGNLGALFAGMRTTPAPTHKRQASLPPTTPTSISDLIAHLIGQAQNLFNNAPVALQAHCQSLTNADASKTKRQSASGEADASASVDTSALALGSILSHCVNVTFPSSFGADLQTSIRNACQNAAALAANASSSAVVSNLLHHNLDLSQAAQSAASALRGVASNLMSTIDSCKAALQNDPNNGQLQQQFASTVASCQSIGASVRGMLSGYTPGASNSGAGISAALQAQISMCQQQLQALRGQFQTEAQNSCPGVAATVRCIKRHALSFNFTIPAAFNCSETFVDALQNGAAIFNQTVTAWCADAAHADVCSKFQKNLVTADLHLTGATDPVATSADPSTTATDALCRRDASFTAFFADPSNADPSKTKRDTAFADAVASFSTSCPGMTACSTSNSPPPANVPAQTTVSVSVPPIPGVDDVKLSSSSAPVTAAVKGSASTLAVASLAALVGVAALI